MRATSKLLALALTAALQPAVAGVVSLDFEGTSGVNKVDNLYASRGVTFAGDAWSITSNQNNCNGVAFFSRPGSCGGLLLGLNPFSAPGASTASMMIDLADGFITEFSFVYGIRTSSNVSIKIFDGLDGQGTLLQSVTGLTGSACSNNPLLFCNWNSSTIKFSGVARSVVVSGLDQRLMMDDLQFITPSATGRLPEPTSIALVLGALGAVGWARKRAAR
jgi:hypothetical protein